MGQMTLRRRALLQLLGAALTAPALPRVARAAAPGRLILDDQTVARAKAGLAAHPQGKDVLRRVTKRAEELLALPPARREYEPGRQVMLPTSREVLERVQTLGAVAFVQGDQRMAPRAIEEVLAACAQPDWNPVHFLDTAEMSHAVALGLDWFGAAMTPEQRQAVVAALLEKGVRPALAEHRGAARWTTATHNWNLVCNGGMGVTALALRGDAPAESAELLSLSLRSVRAGFASFAPDGGWVEGPAYWDYGTRYAAYLLAALESAGVDDGGLAAMTGVAETGRFFLHLTAPGGKLFNFADCNETTRRSAHRFWLARRYTRPQDASHELAREGGARGMHLAWFPEQVAAPAESGEPLDAQFKTAQVATFRSAWGDPKALYLACKGGDNAANHSHLDLGGFVLDAGGERFALDLGPDDYALPGYFDRARRYAYFRNASQSHNLLLAGGASQALDARAPIALFRSTPRLACAVVDLDAAYPGLKHRRGFALVDRDTVVIVDEIAPEAPVDLAWQMLTGAAVESTGDRIVLRRGQAALTMIATMPPGVAPRVEAVEAPAPQIPVKDVRRLSFALGNIASHLRLAVAFTAVGDVSARARAVAAAPLSDWATLD
ncbi:MAG: heparinase II/III family protein [Rhodospirillales bacterium]|nr:heparinase II/III family protein [Rhodospirillales bacterium]